MRGSKLDIKVGNRCNDLIRLKLIFLWALDLEIKSELGVMSKVVGPFVPRVYNPRRNG